MFQIMNLRQNNSFNKIIALICYLFNHSYDNYSIIMMEQIETIVNPIKQVRLPRVMLVNIGSHVNCF